MLLDYESPVSATNMMTLSNKERLLKLEATDGQKLLDTLQQLLDVPELDSRFRKDLIVALQRISTRTGLYPTCYELEGIEQIGQYPVGAGGFADIYKAMFQGQVVCLKTMRLYQGDQIEHVLKKLSKEVVLWSQLSHPNVLEMYGLFRFQGRPALVAAWIENGDINGYLQRNPSASRPRLVLDVGRGLVYLHGLGLIHGDLKGSNVLVDDTGRALLADFGISSVSDTNILAWTSQTKGVSKGGSVRWQAPELFLVGDNDNEELEAPKNTTASDVYALGCVALEVLISFYVAHHIQFTQFPKIFTGNVPFAYLPNDFNVMLQVQSGVHPKRPPISDPSWTKWGLTEEIWLFMERCWNQNPSHRPPTATILQFLTLPDEKDPRLGSNSRRLAAVDFRRQMDKSSGIISVEALDTILKRSNNLDTEQVKGHEGQIQKLHEEDWIRGSRDEEHIQGLCGKEQTKDLRATTLFSDTSPESDPNTSGSPQITPIIERHVQAPELTISLSPSRPMQREVGNVQNELCIQDDDMIYLVASDGVGKGTFINCALNREAISPGKTRTVSPFDITDAGLSSGGGRVFLVNTPDFNDAQWDNNWAKLSLILKWLEKSCQPDARLGGIIIFASDESRTGLPEFIINWVRLLKGKFFNYVALVTVTPASQLDFPPQPLEIAVRSLLQISGLQERFENGCHIASFDGTTASARQILNIFPKQPGSVEGLRSELRRILGQQNTGDRSFEFVKLGVSILGHFSRRRDRNS
ncbi:Serine/threonine-protein kinase HT1 [Termitomyces sp. J132]|nr:Serine/threonine-protein kinase HT1 [Termitomyces sp. J132]